jgi:hypothetical protein
MGTGGLRSYHARTETRKPPETERRPLLKPRQDEPFSRGAEMLRLQRLAGNDAVSSWIASVQRNGPGPAPALAPPVAGPEQADITAYDGAKGQHDTNRTTLLKFVNQGWDQKKDRMLKNSCEWVRSGRIKIFPLTPTHDSAARAANAGKASGAAYFSYPAGDLMGPAVYYKRKAAADAAYDNTNVNLQDSTAVDGFQNPGEIAIMQSAIDQGRQYLWGVLRHEIQHAADFHADTDLDRYKTEFRAYWLGSREYNAISPTRQVHRKGWDWNARQYAIFKNLYTSADYAYVKTAWDAEAGKPRANRIFQQALVAFNRPESINPANSIRIDEFYKKLQATSKADCDADTAKAPNANVAALRVAVAALRKAERGDMRGNPEIAAALKNHLKGRVLKAIKKVLAAK